VCENSVGGERSCDFRSGRVILQQTIEPEQMRKLLEGGRTDILRNFVSNRTRRKFAAFLVWKADEGKVGFEFEPRAKKVGARATVVAAEEPAPVAARRVPVTKATKTARAAPAAKAAKRAAPAKRAVAKKATGARKATQR
jgi:DNA topoisomerase-3